MRQALAALKAIVTGLVEGIRGPLNGMPSRSEVQTHQMRAARWNLRSIILSLHACGMSYVVYRLTDGEPFAGFVILTPAIVLCPFYTYWAGVHRGIAEQMEHALVSAPVRGYEGS